MRLTNTTRTDIVFGDSNRAVRFANRIIVLANSRIDIDIELVVPLVMFDRGFQNSVASGDIVLNFGSINSSRARIYLCAIRALLDGSPNWDICLLPGQSSSSSSFSSSSSSFSSSSFSSSSFSSSSFSSSSFSSSSFSSSSSSFSSSSSSSFSSSSSSFSSSSSSGASGLNQGAAQNLNQGADQYSQ